MTELTPASPASSSGGPLSIDFDASPASSGSASTGWSPVDANSNQLPLPLDLSSSQRESAALDAATPPAQPVRRPLNWTGLWAREKRWIQFAAGLALGVTLLLGAGIGLGYRESLRIRAGMHDAGDAPLRDAFGHEIYVAPEPPHKYFEGRGQLLYILTGETTENDDKYTGLTDTIMVCLLDFNYNRVKVLSIPRDTLVHYGKRWGRINEAASIRGDITALAPAVSGFLTVPVDNVVAVNYDGFKQMIDALGGVDLVVPKRMKYDDRAGGLHIDFEPGPQHMDGQKALEYARFRHDAEGDFGRIRRQQQLITDLKQQKLNFSLIPKVPGLLSAVRQAVATSEDLSYEQMRALMLFLARLDRADIEFATLPEYGIMYGGASVLVPRYDETRELLTRFFSDQPLDPVGPPLPPVSHEDAPAR